MKRWNGWGDVNYQYHLPETAKDFLQSKVGEGGAYADAALDNVLASVPESRIPTHPLVTTDPEERIRHARGQSLPDWVAMRSGKYHAFPDGVAYPTSRQEVADLLQYASDNRIKVIPYGGGSSVLGHVNPRPQDGPTLSIDMARMNRFLDFDSESRLATFEAGILGPELESLLNKRGYTLGHFPQSFEYSSLGGWLATRSCGQQCFYYGRIEELLAGGHIETLQGPMDLPPLPASAAGPDVRQLILGSEGRLGVITDAVLRVRPLPEYEKFAAVFFPDYEHGTRAVRALINAGVETSMLRISDAQETEVTLELAGKQDLVKIAKRLLSLFGMGKERCLVIYGITGDKRTARWIRRKAFQIFRSHGGFPVDFVIGETWKKTRFTYAYLRNTLWDMGYALDTLETAMPWEKVLPAQAAMKKAILDAGEAAGIHPLVFSHLSHHYRDGSAIYVTYLWPRSPEPDQILDAWNMMKTAASKTIVEFGGTISHQHGVGTDHLPYLVYEKSAIGMDWLGAVIEHADPDHILNPGKLLEHKEV